MNENSTHIPSLSHSRWGFLLFLLGVLGFLLWAWGNGWPPAILEVDIRQERINQALPMPRDGITIRQDFYARHDGLRQIEVQFARYASEGGAPELRGDLFFKLFDDQGQLLREQTLDTGTIRHNQIWQFYLYRQAQSAGRRYTLEVTGNNLTALSLWGYKADTLAGDLTVIGAETEVRDLRLITRYELTATAAIREVLTALQRDATLFGLALGLLFMPGCLILQLAERARVLLSPPQSSERADFGNQRWDIAAWWGVALALGLSIHPLLWFWMTQVGLRWTATTLWLVLGLGWSAVIALWIIKRKQGFAVAGVAALAAKEGREGKEGKEERFHHLILLLILFGALAVRLLAIRDLVFPLWVDSIRHGLITSVMAAKGQVLYDYAPLLPMIERFPYHFGYHTLPASLLMMTDWALPRILLSLGQLLNALMPLSIYSASWLLTKRREEGLLAAFLVAFPFLFPGYYATWGRFTQLTGMLIMPLLVAMTWLMLRGSEEASGGLRGARGRNGESGVGTLAAREGREKRGVPALAASEWLVALLASGLFLVHLRVFLYWLPFPVLVWLSTLLIPKHRLAATQRVGVAAVVGGLLVMPRALYLLKGTSVDGLTHQIPGYNEFPMGYLTTGWEEYFIWLAGASLLIIIIAWLRKEAWATLPLSLGLWVATLFALLGGEYIGLPESWVVNLNSMYITLFLPLALILGITLPHLWRLIDDFLKRIKQPMLSRLLYLPLGTLLTATLLFGIHHQLTILNKQTILAYPDDLAALDWIKANTPPEARFAISSWLWLANAWSGSDGGAWLFLLTGRESSTPPADYIYNRAYAQKIKDFNEKASTIKEWSNAAAAEFLRQNHITHLFVGTKGGFLDPYALSRNPALRLLYQQNGTFIFEVIGNQ